MINIICMIAITLIIVIGSITIHTFYAFRKIRVEKTTNIIYPTDTYLKIGSICSIELLSLVAVMSFLETSSSITEKYVCASLLMLFAILLGGYLILFCANYRIILYEDHFVYQNFWRIKKTIYYKDVVFDNTKLYPQVRQKLDNGKTKLIFKMGGMLENENIFMEYYKNWKNNNKKSSTSNKSKKTLDSQSSPMSATTTDPTNQN